MRQKYNFLKLIKKNRKSEYINNVEGKWDIDTDEPQIRANFLGDCPTSCTELAYTFLDVCKHQKPEQYAVEKRLATL